MQFPKELQPDAAGAWMSLVAGLNEVQLPKELQPGADALWATGLWDASMKCSSRRNCNRKRWGVISPSGSPQ